MSYEPKPYEEWELSYQEYLDQLPQEYLEAEYPGEYRARRDWSIGWHYYGPWF